MNKIFYRGAHCVFMVYDITKRDSFVNIEEWEKEVKQNTNECLMYLVGNQVDNEHQREVQNEEADEYLKEHGLTHYGETSAKTGQNVEDIFIRAAKELYLKHKDEMGQNKKMGESLNKRSSMNRPNSAASGGSSSGCKC